MSKTVRIALIIAFLIFVAGITWAITASRGDKKDSTTKTASTPTLVGTPSSTTASAPAPSTPAPTASKPASKKGTSKSQTVVTEVVEVIEVVEETTDEVSSGAWASAGAGRDGSSWSFAEAEVN